jgi:DNA mismatch endonuclease (patch repair protein)
MDTFSPAKRSAIMRAVKSKDTSPELIVRRLVHGLGYRFRLHRKDLPGKPDLVFPSRGAVIFVHGCFWHWHGCKRSRMPATNKPYWTEKIGRNVQRDRRTRRELTRLGWRSLIIWECQTSDIGKIANRVTRFLEAG